MTNTINMIRQYLILISLLLIPASMYAQSEIPYPVNIQSPNAASLGKYGDIPVSFYTGALDLSIPIYTHESKYVKLPVTLKYDASGIRVNSHPSWVGQNWSLDAGGVIVRTIRGYEDEAISPWSRVMLGYFKVKNRLNSNNIYASDLYEDLEPDIFTFNFMGKTGKFFMDSYGNWQVIGDWNIEVIFDPENDIDYSPFSYSFPIHISPHDYIRYTPRTINGFRLRDDEGNLYEFGFKKDAVEYSIDFFRQYEVRSPSLDGTDFARWVSNAWYLTRVEDRYGNWIYDFTYERGKFIADFHEFYSFTSVSSKSGSCGFYAYPSMSDPNYYGEMVYYAGNLISPVYLKKIRHMTDGISIVFDSSDSHERPYKNQVLKYSGYRAETEAKNRNIPYPYSYLQGYQSEPYAPYINSYYEEFESRRDTATLGLRWRKLDAIRIAREVAYNSYDCFLSVKMTYNENRISETERLNLTKLDFEYRHDSYNNLRPEYCYEFKYNDFQSLPPYMSRKTDHWGYYNGNSHNLNIIDQERRNANFTYLKTGMLTGVKYPTGGYSEFEYEPHTYTKTLINMRQDIENSSGIAGGLRIAKIKNFNGEKTITKRYEYQKGILTQKPKYIFKWSYGNTTTFINNSISSIIPLSNYFGSHICYPDVVEYINDASRNGKIHYSFLSWNDVKDELPERHCPGPSINFSETDFMRGKLKGKYTYSTEGIKESVEYTYRQDETSFLSQYSMASSMKELGFLNTFEFGEDLPGLIISCPLGSLYKIYYPRYDVIEEETITYTDDKKQIVTTKIYDKSDDTINIAKDKYAQRRSVNIRRQNAEYITTSNGRKGYELTYPGKTTTLDSAFNNNFMVGIPLKKTDIFKMTEETVYDTMFYKWKKVPVPKQIKTYRSDNVALAKTISAMQYDSIGNLVCYQSPDGIYHTILWDTRRHKPTIFIDNAKYNDVCSAIVNIGRLSMNDINCGFAYDTFGFYQQLRNALPQTSIQIYEYTTTQKIKRIIEPNGLYYSYIYDWQDRLFEVRDVYDNTIKSYSYIYRTEPYPGFR